MFKRENRVTLKPEYLDKYKLEVDTKFLMDTTSKSVFILLDLNSINCLIYPTGGDKRSNYYLSLDHLYVNPLVQYLMSL